MVHRRRQRNGDAGIGDTICLMRKYVRDYKSNLQVQALVAKFKRSTNWETAKALHDFVVDNIRYESDPPDKELVKSVKHTIFGNMKYGDCDDLSVALATLLEACGIETKFRTVAWRPGKNAFSHVYVMAYISEAKGWVAFDPTMGKQGKSKEVKYNRERTWNDSRTFWIR